MLTGVAIILTGLLALWQRGVPDPARLVAVYVLIVLVTVAVFLVVDVLLRLRSINGPRIGVYITVAGAVLAGIAGPRLLARNVPPLKDQDAKLIDEAKRMLQGGWSEAEVIAFLREAGLSWLRSVRAFGLATGKGLGYAKPAVLNSETWADERPRINHFHRELNAAIDQEERARSNSNGPAANS